MLEAAESDVTYENGNFLVVGTDRRVSLFEVAARAREAGDTLDTKATRRHAADLPERLPYRRGRDRSRRPASPRSSPTRRWTMPASCSTTRWSAGQLVGGLAQGIGQALLENAVYDAGNGQLVTGTFMDYAMPRATDMPPVAEANHNARATTNPLGVKGVGEAGTTGSIAAIMNAIANAIPEGRGVEHRHAGDARQGVGGVPRRVTRCTDGTTDGALPSPRARSAWRGGVGGGG